jgi:predicted double-glycine peptidase
MAAEIARESRTGESMLRVCRHLVCALMNVLLVYTGPAGAQVTNLQSDATSGTIKRHTLKGLRDKYVVKQQLDFSCGAAALATLMTYYYGDATSEAEILQLLIAQLTKDERELKVSRGFSLLDLKRAAEAKGFQAAGFKLTAEQLTKLVAPVIVFVQPLGYKHFAVLRGIDRGRVFLADPARGNLRMSIGRFLSEWDGIVFVLGKAGEESIITYPLALPRPDYIQPQLLGVNGILNLETVTTDLAVRSQPR